MQNTFTAIIEKRDKWYIGYVEELPGANTQGKTIDEVRKNLKEAVELILLSNREITENEIKDKKFIREEITVIV